MLLVNANADIVNWSALGGKKVACILGTTGHMQALDWQSTLTPPPVLITVHSPYTLTEALITGELDAVILDHVTAREVRSNTEAIQILPEMITDEPYVVAARMDDNALIEAIDALFESLVEDGTLQALQQKWM